MAENGILKLGRLTAFQAHQIEHQLGAYTDCNHGQGLAVIHPAYYRHIYKFARFAVNVWGIVPKKKTEEDVALMGITALEDFIRECGLPMRLMQLKSKLPFTNELLRAVADSTNIIESGYGTLTHDDILTECR